ncbi:hypothetical protein D3C80_1820510 [compost metagenome]
MVLSLLVNHPAVRDNRGEALAVRTFWQKRDIIVQTGIVRIHRPRVDPDPHRGCLAREWCHIALEAFQISRGRKQVALHSIHDPVQCLLVLWRVNN